MRLFISKSQNKDKIDNFCNKLFTFSVLNECSKSKRQINNNKISPQNNKIFELNITVEILMEMRECFHRFYSTVHYCGISGVLVFYLILAGSLYTVSLTSY